MQTLFKLKIEKIMSEVRKSFDVDLIILRSSDVLSYLFAEIYNPPPNEVSVTSVVIDMRTSSVTAYVSLLDYFRVREYYGDIPMLNIVPFFSWSTTFLDNLNVISSDEMKKNIENLIDKARAIASDSLSACESRLCVNIKPLINKIRRTKLDEEVSMIKNAIRISEKAIEEVSTLIASGISEKDIAGKLIELALSFGADGIAFTPIVAIGRNSAKPHHIPQAVKFSGREPILIDFGVRFKGYVSDVTRILIRSNLSAEYEGVHEYINLLNEVIDTVVKELKSDIKAGFIDSIARDLMKRKNIDTYFIHGLGHGIGVDIHEPPRISSSSADMLVLGDVVTIEPGIYIYNRFGVRIEENVYIDSSGGKLLTTLPRVIQL